MPGITFNPFTDNLDFTGSGVIPELTSDPVSPYKNQSWVLVTQTGSGGNAGIPIGMLLSLTYPGNASYTYQFSYYTTEGTIKRVTLS